MLIGVLTEDWTRPLIVLNLKTKLKGGVVMGVA